MSDNARSIQNYFSDQLKNSGMYCEQMLSDMEVSKDVLLLVPPEMAALYHIFPIDQKEDTIVLVTDLPRTFKQRVQIEKKLAHPVKLLWGSAENLHLALSKFYSIQNYRQNAVQRDVEEASTPLKGTIHAMLQGAAREHASDIHILPQTRQLAVFFRINGHMHDVTSSYNFPVEQSKNVISLIKQMDASGNADFMKTNMPNEGSFTFVHGKTEVFVRIETLPIGNADGLEKVNLRLLPQTNGPHFHRKTLDDIGYDPADLAVIKNVLYKNSTGLFINSGPVGAGKTTSLYAQIHYILDTIGEPLTVITIDDPIEIRDEDFAQVQVHQASKEELNLTAEKIMLAILRSDPDIVLYNEIRSAVSAMVAITASNTGNKVFSTVHAADCTRTISRLLDFENISKSTLLSELKLIISQRLVARLCPYCSHTHVLTQQERGVLTKEEICQLQAGNLREKGTAQEIKACGHCNRGEIGRMAIAEYVEFNMDIRDALLHQESFSQIRDILKKYKFRSMWDKGLDMVFSGAIELNELIQVVGKE